MPLVLDLLRHGEAEPAGPQGDSHRRLTPAGEHSILQLAALLARQHWKPERVFSSPLRRARDTALIVTRGAGLQLPVQELPELMAETEPSTLLDALAALEVTAGHALLVGHQPQLGRLAGYLTGVDRAVAAGELMRVELPVAAAKGAGALVLSLRP